MKMVEFKTTLKAWLNLLAFLLHNIWRIYMIDIDFFEALWLDNHHSSDKHNLISCELTVWKNLYNLHMIWHRNDDLMLDHHKLNKFVFTCQRRDNLPSHFS